jgi:hypothetical protein
MINTFPPQNQNFKYLQTNRSDDLGSIWSSFNLDFQTKYGTLTLGKKLVTSTTSGDDAQLGLPVAFTFWSNRWWAVCGSRLFYTDDADLTGDFSECSIPFQIGDSTSQFDITNPSGTTFRYTYDGNGTDPEITTATVPTGAAVLISAGSNFNTGNEGSFTVTGSGANYFEITNASGIAENDKTVGSAISVLGGTTPNLSIRSDICAFNNQLWVSSDSFLYRLQSTTSVWRKVAKFGTNYQYVMHKLDYSKTRNRLYYISSHYTIDSVDILDVVTSAGAYSINLVTDAIPTTMVSSSSSTWIGMNSVIDISSTYSKNLKGEILLWDAFSSQIDKRFEFPSAGILAMAVVKDIPYAVDTNGRILKYNGFHFEEITRFPMEDRLLNNSASYNAKFIHANGMVATKNDTILFNINNLNENDTSTINENFPSGIWELDLNTFNLTHKHSFSLKAKDSSTVNDYGQNRVSAVGAILVNSLAEDSASGRPELLAGATYYTNASDTASAIFITSPIDAGTDYEGQKRGYFVTTWFESPQITSNWTRLWATFKKMLNATDKMIFKDRLDDDEPVEATITWVTQTTFTTTTDVSAYEGFEAEIIQGTGSGACCDITDVSEDGGTYTVTIRSEVPVTATTAKARFQKWIYLGEIASQTLAYGSLPIIANDVRIQIKGILEWTEDNEFTKMAIVSKDDININP